MRDAFFTFFSLTCEENLGESFTLGGEEYPPFQNKPSLAIFGLFHAKVAAF